MRFSSFEKHYNILYDGLKNVSHTHLSRRHSQYISPSVMTFPLEFKSLKPVLRTFISALFQENPYQFKPVFRGFTLPVPCRKEALKAQNRTDC